MKNVVIIGAGPAGLTAAYTLLNESSEYHPIIIEASEFIGGISRTARYNGNRIDIGGHRFFSKNKEVMKLWMDILPLQGAPSKDDKVLGRTHTFSDDPEIDPDKIDNVFLARTRLSRIYFRKRFFDYPISLKPATFINMGFVNTMKAGFGYLGSVIHKLPETSLENFYINRFGKPLYQMFFEDYTEKLWGVHPSNIAADWGAQRVKGLSVWKVITSALSKPFKKNKNNVETSLIDEFYYPKFGPGQLWERMAEIDREKGAELLMQHEVVRVNAENGSVRSVTVRCTDSGSPDFGKERTIECDFLVSSMAVKDLGSPGRAGGYTAHRVGASLPGFHHRRPAARPARDPEQDQDPDHQQYSPGLLDIHSGARGKARKAPDIQQLVALYGGRQHEARLGGA